jgi:hypothetical protein
MKRRTDSAKLICFVLVFILLLSLSSIVMAQDSGKRSCDCSVKLHDRVDVDGSLAILEGSGNPHTIVRGIYSRDYVLPKGKNLEYEFRLDSADALKRTGIVQCNDGQHWSVPEDRPPISTAPYLDSKILISNIIISGTSEKCPTSKGVVSFVTENPGRFFIAGFFGVLDQYFDDDGETRVITAIVKRLIKAPGMIVASVQRSFSGDVDLELEEFGASYGENNYVEDKESIVFNLKASAPIARPRDGQVRYSKKASTTLQDIDTPFYTEGGKKVVFSLDFCNKEKNQNGKINARINSKSTRDLTYRVDGLHDEILVLFESGEVLATKISKKASSQSIFTFSNKGTPEYFIINAGKPCISPDNKLRSGGGGGSGGSSGSTTTTPDPGIETVTSGGVEYVVTSNVNASGAVEATVAGESIYLIAYQATDSITTDTIVMAFFPNENNFTTLDSALFSADNLAKIPNFIGLVIGDVVALKALVQVDNTVTIPVAYDIDLLSYAITNNTETLPFILRFLLLVEEEYNTLFDEVVSLSIKDNIDYQIVATNDALFEVPEDDQAVAQILPLAQNPNLDTFLDEYNS